MKTSETTEIIFSAIHNVQQAVGTIDRSNKADIGTYSYKYADLTAIWEQLKPLFKKEGLTIVQSPTSKSDGMAGDFLETMIYHSGGEYISDKMRLVLSRDDPQGMGAAITYARRYMLSSMLGLVTEEDNDAQSVKYATGDQKKEWVRAYNIVAKKANPETTPTYNDFMKFVQEVYGKHPSKIMAKENQAVLDTIKAFE